MAITAISHSVCLDCSEGEFTITGDVTGSNDGALVNSVYVTDPSGNVTTYEPGVALYQSPYTYDIPQSGSSTNITGSNSVNSVTLSWTTAINTTYSFILRSMVSGVVQDYAISFLSTPGATATEIGEGIASLVDSLPPSLNLLDVSYTPGQESLTITGNTNVYFGVDALVNLTASSVTANPNTASTFEDGFWIVKWVLTDGSTYTSTTNSIFLCNVEKCVREKASKVDVGCGCCGSRESEEAMDAIMYLEGIKSAAACGKLEKAKTILSGLEDICNNDCKHC